jgi:hypothetical protein
MANFVTITSSGADRVTPVRPRGRTDATTYTALRAASGVVLAQEDRFPPRGCACRLPAMGRVLRLSTGGHPLPISHEAFFFALISSLFALRLYGAWMQQTHWYERTRLRALGAWAVGVSYLLALSTRMPTLYIAVGLLLRGLAHLIR